MFDGLKDKVHAAFDSIQELSKNIESAKEWILKHIPTHLDELITHRLISQEDGLYYKILAEDPPQVTAFKHLINGLHEVETSLKSIKLPKNLEEVRVFGEEVPLALYSFYDALKMFEEVCPEARRLISENYVLFQPIMTQIQQILQKMDVFAKFMDLSGTDKISKGIDFSTKILGSNVSQWNRKHSLITTATQIAELVKEISFLRAKEEIDEQKSRRIMELIKALFAELNNTPLGDLTFDDLKNSQMMQELFAWFKEIDGTNFTKNSFQKYLIWVNNYLPAFILFLDQLEQTNYLKIGSLSGIVCKQVEPLSLQVNSMLSESNFGVSDRVFSMESLNALRDSQFNAMQIKNVQIMSDVEAQQSAAYEFYSILANQSIQYLEHISEPDRYRLHVLYPKIQLGLAHYSLHLDSHLADFFNQKSNSTKRMIKIKELLVSEQRVTEFLASERDLAQFKVVFAEKGREQLKSEPNMEVCFIEDKAKKCIEHIKAGLATQKDNNAFQIIPVKPEHLGHFMGTCVVIQKLKLSEKIARIRRSLEELLALQAHLIINSKTMELIKKLENSLGILENSLSDFEKLNLPDGRIARLINKLNFFGPKKAQWLAILSRAMNFYHLGTAAKEVITSFKNLALDPQKESSGFHEKINSLQSQFMDWIGPLFEKNSIKNPSSELIPQAQGYAKKLSQLRGELMELLKNKLTAPFADRLRTQATGIPFVTIEHDPPQVAAFKKLINSMYHAECALIELQGMHKANLLDYFVAFHKGVGALAELYKSLSLLAQASSEMQTFIREQSDLIKPLIHVVQEIVNNFDWKISFDALLGVTDKAGSIVGNLLNSMNADEDGPEPLVQLAELLPELMNDVSSFLDPATKKSAHDLRLSEKKMDDIHVLFAVLFQGQSAFTLLTRGYSAIRGLNELRKKIQQEKDTLERSALLFYQQQMHDWYLSLIQMYDELETRCYVQPGSLSKTIAFHLDEINDKLNELIDEKHSKQLKRIPLSFDMIRARIESLNDRIKKQWMSLFALEQQQTAADTFFALLSQYADRAIIDISTEDLAALRLAFREIQQAMAYHDLALTNRLTDLLNELGCADFQLEQYKISIDSVLKQKSYVNDYLMQRTEARKFDIEVVEHQMMYVESNTFDIAPEELKELKTWNIPQLRSQFLEEDSKRTTIVAPGDLVRVKASSVNSMQGNFAYIQELKLSDTIAILKEGFSALIENHFSARVNVYLKKPQGQTVHVIYATDPKKVQQIKSVENTLYHLEEALKTLESLDLNGPLISIAEKLLNIADHGQQLIYALEPFEELKDHYGPEINAMVNFISKIKFSYQDKITEKDVKEIKYLFAAGHKRFLLRKTPRDKRTEEAFLKAGEGIQESIDTGESLLQKGLGLGYKFLSLTAQEVNNATTYLDAQFEQIFGNKTPYFYSAARSKMENKQIDEEMQRVASQLENYGFNLDTLRSLKDVWQRIHQVGNRAGELAIRAHEFVIQDMSKLKESVYDELISKLSKEEDYLGLKPGQLIEPAMQMINHLFLSVALELDMPFREKRALMDETRFLSRLLKNTQNEIQELKYQTPSVERDFQMAMKRDKRAFLEREMKRFNEEDAEKLKSALLHKQFAVLLSKHLKKTTLKSPLSEQYAERVCEHYWQHKAYFLNQEDCRLAVLDELQLFQKATIADYLIVSETCAKLHQLRGKLPRKNKELKVYLEGLIGRLENNNVPINDRATTAISLPHDQLFQRKLSAADQGTSFLKHLAHFLKILISSIFEAVKTGSNVVFIYRKNQMEQKIKNIEKGCGFFKGANAQQLMQEEFQFVLK